MTNNTETLNELLRAIDYGQGEFALLLVRCNYSQLRDRLLAQLHTATKLELLTLTLQDTAATLYRNIREQLDGRIPAALSVLGLEHRRDLNDILAAANNMRESFRQDFPFPLLLWLDDALLTQVQRQMPDFKSWATTTFHFELETSELEQHLQVLCDRYLEAIVARLQLIPKFGLLSKTDLREAQLAEAELFKRGVTLAPEIEGAIALAEGSLLFGEPDQVEAVLRQFQASLGHWQRAENLLGQGIAQFYSSHCSAQQEDWSTAQTQREEALANFAAAGRSDLVAKFCNQMGELWVKLEEWDKVRSALPEWQERHAQMPALLAQDLSLEAKLAEHQQDWVRMAACAEQAIALYGGQGQTAPLSYKLQRAVAIAHQNDLPCAIAALETARRTHQPDADPAGFVALLSQLKTFYRQNQQYRAAFQIQQRRRTLEFQYQMRAFVGAGRLPSLEEGTERSGAFVALGRETDIQTLVTKRIGEPQHNLTVLCGMSGVGKSSVVEAGLVPELNQTSYEARHALPVLVRVYGNWVVELGQALRDALAAAYPEILLPEPLETVAALTAQLQHNAHHKLWTVLIFDQFEEFFFVCTEPEQRQGFYRFFADCLERKAIQYTTVILALREDYLHELLEFEDYLQGLVASGEALSALKRDFLGREQRQRIENFAPRVAEQVMGDLCARSAFRMEPELITAVVTDLTDALGRVRPVEVQVVGAQLEARKITTVEAYRALGTNPKLALAEEWVADIVATCDPAVVAAAWRVLMALTKENGTRPFLTLGELQTELENFGKVSALPDVELEGDILAVLVGSGLVVRWPQEPEDRFQLVHDYVVGPIRRRYQRDWQRQFEGMVGKARREEAQRKKAERRMLWISSSAAVVLAGLASFAGWLAYQSNRAERRAEIRELVAQTARVQERVSNKRAMLLAVEAHNQIQHEALVRVNVVDLYEVLWEGLPHLPTTVSQNQHVNTVRSVAFSPDGKYVLTGSSDNTAKISRTETGEEVTYIQHENRVWSVAFSPDGKYVLTGSGDNTAKISYAETGEEITRIQHENRVRSVAFSPDGKYVLTGSEDNTAKISHAETGEEIARIQHRYPIWSVAFSPDGKYVLTGSEDNTAKISHTESGQEVTQIQHENPVWSVAFSPSGEYVLTGSYDNTAKISYTTTGEEVAHVQHENPVWSVAFSPGGEYVLTGSYDNTAKISRTQTEKEVTRIQHEHDVWSVAFSPDGEHVLTGSADRTARISSTETGEEVARIQHEKRIWSVAFSSNGKYVLTGSEDNTAKVSHTETGKIVTYIQHENPVLSVVFSLDEKYVLTGSGDNTAKVSHTATGEEVVHIQHENRVRSVAFSPDGKYVLTGSEDNTAKVSSAETGEEIARIRHGSPILSVAFSPDGKYVLTGSEDNTAKVSSAKTGKKIARIRHENHVRSVAFSPGGEYVLTGSYDNTAKISRIETGEEVARIQHENHVRSVAFSPDGEYVLTGSYDNTAKISRTETGEEVARIQHENRIRSVVFSPSGEYVLTGSSDNTALISPVQTNPFIVAVCQRTQQNLSAKVWQRYINSNLATYRRTCPKNPVHPTVIQAALDLVAEDEIKQARSILNRVHKLDPNADLYPLSSKIETSPKVAIRKQLAALR
ncbi:MAG: hypothetical protein F6J87_18635 [Spirulina sp. SIO3F2]|nr:hypothetical protein [Spirulina sp. SIO3F2]